MLYDFRKSTTLLEGSYAPFVFPPLKSSFDDEDEYETMMEWWQGKTEGAGDKAVPLPQIPHGLPRGRTGAPWNKSTTSSLSCRKKLNFHLVARA
jgi:hypothetical protein